MDNHPRDEVIAVCNAKPGSVEDYPFGDEVAVFKVAGKMFALVTLGPAEVVPEPVREHLDPALASAAGDELVDVAAIVTPR